MTKEQLRSTGEALIALTEGATLEYSYPLDIHGWLACRLENERNNTNWDPIQALRRGLILRVKPAKATRPIRVDELPYIFETKEPNEQYHLWTREGFYDAMIKRCIKIGATWTVDGKTFKSFEVEETK